MIRCMNTYTTQKKEQFDLYSAPITSTTIITQRMLEIFEYIWLENGYWDD